MFQMIQELVKRQEERHIELMNRAMPVHDNSIVLLQTAGRIERTTNNILKDVEGKDYTDRLQQLLNVITQSQSTIMEGIPQHMTNSEFFQTRILSIAIANATYQSYQHMAPR
jgi:lectin, mannose-binding 1